MVIVSSSGGSNIGFITHEVDPYEFQSLAQRDGLHFPPKKILSKLKDGDETIRNILCHKISTENYALNKCKWIMKGHRTGILIDVFATEFQFDNKKLIVYLKKHENVSVCRLVRKLFEIFKMKIKIVETTQIETLYRCAMQYLNISRLEVSFDEIFHPVPDLSVPPQTTKSAATYATPTASYDNNYHEKENNSHISPKTQSYCPTKYAPSFCHQLYHNESMIQDTQSSGPYHYALSYQPAPTTPLSTPRCTSRKLLSPISVASGLCHQRNSQREFYSPEQVQYNTPPRSAACASENLVHYPNVNSHQIFGSQAQYSPSSSYSHAYQNHSNPGPNSYPTDHGLTPRRSNNGVSYGSVFSFSDYSY